ncbi:MAG: hypothetical protein Q4G04_06385 [bacterium]|nr:hypothetical protein [bacterium]
MNKKFVTVFTIVAILFLIGCLIFVLIRDDDTDLTKQPDKETAVFIDVDSNSMSLLLKHSLNF